MRVVMTMPDNLAVGDDIIIIILVFMHNIVFVDDIVPVLHDMLILLHAAVCAAVVFLFDDRLTIFFLSAIAVAPLTIASMISFVTHLDTPPFVDV